MPFFNKVEVIPDASRAGKRLQITGLNVQNLKYDIKRYFGRNTPKIQNSGTSMQYHIFSIVVKLSFFGTTSISFEEFFTLEVSLVFKWLYQRFNRDVYKDAYDALNALPRMQALHTPLLNLPSSISNRIQNINVDLMDYQSDFLKLYYNATKKNGLDGYVMAFEQGLGKTYTAIATVYAFNLFPCIITAPKSTLMSWKSSIEKLIPNKLLREDVIRVGDKFTICNYESLSKIESYLKSKPKSVIIDEIQNFRYLNTARTQNIIDVQKRYDIHNVLALSGTPIKALASEMIPIMTMIDPLFRESPQAQYIFKHLYSNPNYDAIASAVLKERLKLYMVKKEVKQVLQLPIKNRYTLPLRIENIEPYELTEVLKKIKIYVDTEMAKRSRRDTLLLLENLTKEISLLPNDIFSNDFKTMYINNVRKWMMSNPMAPDYPLITEDTRNLESMIKQYDSSLYKDIVTIRKNITSYFNIVMGRAIGEYIVRGKIRLLNEVVNQNMKTFTTIIEKSLKKVIIFSTYKEPLEALSKNLTKLGIGNILIESGADYNKRSKEFLNDKTIRVLLGSVQSIGTGTDGMQYASNTIIFLNRPYRSTDSEQAEARIYRKGQDSSCYIYYVDVEKEIPNILGNEEVINEWSKKMLSIAGV